MFLVQINDKDGVLIDFTHIGVDRKIAENHFIDTCKIHVSNWDEYSCEDIDCVLDNGYEHFSNGVVMFIDTDGYASDQEILSALTKQLEKKDVPNRTVEMFRISEDRTWDTVMVELPADTEAYRLEEVARSHADAQYGPGTYMLYNSMEDDCPEF